MDITMIPHKFVGENIFLETEKVHDIHVEKINGRFGGNSLHECALIQ